jgi:hypothetical protein
MRTRVVSPPAFAASALLIIMCSAPLRAQVSGAESDPAAAAARPLITEPVDEGQLTRLKGNTHRLARPEFDLGTAPATLPMQRMLLVLKRSPEQEYGLRKLLDDQQDKKSPNYHKWLTPEQFGRKFGPTDADMQTIASWLQSHGFQVGSTKGRTVLEFSGSASQVQEAFHTTIHKYIVNGEQHWANANDPSIPTALTPAIAGIDSLHNFGRHPMYKFRGLGTREKATGRVSPKTGTEFTFPPGGTNPCNAQDNNCYTVGPFDFATIYNVLPLWTGTPAIDGTGQRVAIVQETNINIADAHAFRTLFGLPTNDPNVILNGPDPGIVAPGSSLEGEADLDVQWSGAVAKGATIDLVVSASTDTTAGTDLSATYIVENNLDGILSESFGLCEPFLGTGNQFYSALWEQAAAQGISVFVASGDQGSAVCDASNAPTQPAVNGLAVNGIASTPFNVAVGGTDFQDAANPETYWNLTNSANQASAKGYIPETTWNSTCTNAILGQFGFSTNAEANCNNPKLSNFLSPIGGSGGVSTLYTKPSWQTGTGVPADNARDVPDVSLFASNGFEGNAYLFCQADASTSGTCDLNAPFTDIIMAGGTSFSSPAMAGIMALVNQKTGSRQGNPNYVFYKLAAQTPATNCNSTTGPAANCVFNDVTSGTIRMPCTTGSASCTTVTLTHQVGINNGYDTTTGYDLATGLGSVNVNNLVTAWANTIFNSTTTTLALNGGTAVNVPHGTSVPVSITVTSSSSGTPGGDVSLIAQSGPNPISNQVGVAQFTLNGGGTLPGAATTQLPGGTYNVRAHYEGDGTFAPSDSALPGIQVTVSAENSSTTLSNIGVDGNGNPVSVTNGAVLPFGTFLFVRADVTSANGSQTCQPPSLLACPTGTVTFTDTFGKLPGPIFNPVANPVALNSQGNTSIGAGVINFDTGNHSISASYAGDASFSPSASTQPVTFTIQPGFTAISSPTNVTVSAGATTNNTTSVQFIASSGFSTPVTFTCSLTAIPQPLETNCPPTTVAGKGANTVVTANIPVNTTAPHLTMLQPNWRPYYFAAFLGGGLPLAGIFFIVAPKRRLAGALSGLALLVLFATLPACGGGGHSTVTQHQDQGTLPGTYTVTVTATAGSLSQNVGSFTLTVQ